MSGIRIPSMTDVLLARRLLRGQVLHTPLEYSHPLSKLTGADVFLKLENQQHAHSFKVRGAMVRMFALTDEEKERGVVTASSGNHAQGVARAASLLGVRAVIYVPLSCPETKKSSILALGGGHVDLRVTGDRYDDTEREAFAAERAEGLTFVSAFEDPWIIAGQGTVGLEMLLDEPELDMIISPLSGGGLLSGITVAARALRPAIKLWGTFAENNPSWSEAWKAGRVVPVDEKDSLADALGGAASSLLFDFIHDNIDGILPVSEGEIGRAMAFVHRVHHSVIEGASATAVAALTSGKIDVKGRRVGIVISGGNVDDRVLLRVINDQQ